MLEAPGVGLTTVTDLGRVGVGSNPSTTKHLVSWLFLIHQDLPVKLETKKRIQETPGPSDINLQ